MISTKCQKLFHCLILKLQSNNIYKALIIDISYKANKQIKRGSITNNNPIQSTPELTVSLYIPEINLEIVIFKYLNIYINRNGIKKIIQIFLIITLIK
jgi:hypothetical protein